MIRNRFAATLLLFTSTALLSQTAGQQTSGVPLRTGQATGLSTPRSIDAEFLGVPDPELAREHLKFLTSAPHVAGSPQDYATAQYVAEKFRAAGLQTEVVPYKVLISSPISISVEAFDEMGKKILAGLTREHVPPAANGFVDHYQDNPDIIPGFNSSSPSGDVTADVVYANYGRLQDFRLLAEMGVSLKGKVALVRYGADFRGVKVYIAQKFGAAGVLIYSDPADDPKANNRYPNGPGAPVSAIQRGSVQFLPIYPGDPTTPGVASVPGLADSQRLPTDKLHYDLPSIPVNPLSAEDAAPILHALGGPAVPPEWQGGLPFGYHAGGSGVQVHMHLVEDARMRTIWDVIGRIPGSTYPNEWVIAGNHRDAWVYGAADPGSGTAAVLETVHGLGELLKHGWRPQRTIVLASWDAEEQGLIGSTEWVEQHPQEMQHAIAYFNLDVAASGPNFSAGAVPSLRTFLRDITKEVPSPNGGTVFDQWKTADEKLGRPASDGSAEEQTKVGDLGSGSDYTPFLQHAGVPCTDVGSDGPFAVYHSVFDNFDWFTHFADPDFVYVQEQARVLGLELIHMADAQVLPFDYVAYAIQIQRYVANLHRKAAQLGMSIDFAPTSAAAGHLLAAARRVRDEEAKATVDAAALNRALAGAERALLIPAGLPGRPWYKHIIYAPGEFTGYAAVVLPGVTDALQANDPERARQQLQAVADALDRAANVLSLESPSEDQ